MQATKTILSLCAAATILMVAGCGGSSAVGPSQPNPSGPLGSGMPAAAPDDFEIVGDEMKSTSATFTKFFLDSVNHQSGGRWTVTNTSGAKAFTLSNTYHSSPKAWVIGQNYWNREDDEIWSNDFTVPAFQDGIRLSFYARWSIASGDGDVASVVLDDGTNQTLITSFDDGQNPDYPNYTKYYFELPSTVGAQTWNVGFLFESDTSGTGWGFGFDSVAVYQTQLAAPTNLTATDGDTGSITIDWDYTPSGTLEPELIYIYRAVDDNGSPGTYSFYTSVGYPASAFTDDEVIDGDVYWYKTTGYRTGYPESADSNEDDGLSLP